MNKIIERFLNIIFDALEDLLVIISRWGTNRKISRLVNN